jgi:hypothetical protein
MFQNKDFNIEKEAFLYVEASSRNVCDYLDDKNLVKLCFDKSGFNE